MGHRRMIVALATVAAVVVATMVWLLAPQDTGSAPPATSDGANGLVRSVAPVARGTTAETAWGAGRLELAQVTEGEIPEFPITSPDQLDGLVAAYDISPGTVLSVGMFVTPPTLDAGLVGQLDNPGHTALAVTLDATRAVGGWLQAGDRVNILVPSTCPDEAALREAMAATMSQGSAFGVGDTEIRCRRARYLYQSVLVLAVNSQLRPLPGAESVARDAVVPQPGAATVVLSLPPRAAQWVATYDNDLWLTLVRSDYQSAAMGQLPLLLGPLPGEDQALLTPYCDDPSSPSSGGAIDPGCAGATDGSSEP